MANQEHLDILKQGVDVWNKWRYRHRDVRPDLSGANLSGADLTEADLMGVNLRKINLQGAILYRAILRGVDLTGANLRKANLEVADLTRANLEGADLNLATLSRANLYGANLRKANLEVAILEHADLKWADLSNANLIDTNLNRANLSNANLSDAILIRADLEGTILERASLTHVNLYDLALTGVKLTNSSVGWSTFANVDLSTVDGLEAVFHMGPSTIGIDTIYRSHGNIPEVFLKGAGVDDTFITYIRSLIGKAIEYYSCFISYSSKDEAFAKRLYADLQNNNVRCWFAPEDLKWGERIRTGIDEAIRLHDKLLLVLSKFSMASGWVEREVKTALTREKKEKRTVLFPVRVDGAVFESPIDWATEIRHERNIGDFTRWKNHDAYEKAFARLLRDLKAAP